MSFLDRVRACAIFTPSAYLPFVVDDARVGFVARDFAAALAPSSDVFAVDDMAVSLAPALPSEPEARTRALAGVLRPLAEQGWMRGWRNEDYDVAPSPGAPALLRMDRAAVPKFGIVAAGIHVNGVVRTNDGLKMWVGRRALDKATSPGKLDQLVGGGQHSGASVRETLLKESAEEADLPPSLAGAAVPVGVVSYRTERREGLRRDVLYTYDLELDADFVPRNTDGEISDFALWPLERVIETVRDTEDFKFNCSLVIIDFLIRHGHIAPDDPDYLAIAHGLRSLDIDVGEGAR